MLWSSCSTARPCSASTTAGAEGDFAIILDEPLKPGDYQITLRATPPGGAAIASLETAVLSIPETRRAARCWRWSSSRARPSELVTVPQPEAAAPQQPPAGRSKPTSAAAPTPPATAPKTDEAAAPPAEAAAPHAARSRSGRAAKGRRACPAPAPAAGRGEGRRRGCRDRRLARFRGRHVRARARQCAPTPTRSCSARPRFPPAAAS